MTNPTIQVGSKVQIAGNMFFNGKPRRGVVVWRQGERVTVTTDEMCWDGPWNIGHVTEVGE